MPSKKEQSSIADAIKKIRKLKEEDAHFSSISGVSAGENSLGLVYHFMKDGKPLDIKAVFDEKTVVPSIAGVFPPASYYEVEAHEMFGIKFDKLDSEHLFLPEDWPKGKHPLRK